MDEVSIINKIQSGCADDFIQLYDFYVKKIYDFIFYKVGNKDDAQDITSDTFLKAFQNINKFDLNKKNKFSSWLYTIANNNVIDYYRKNDKEKSYSWLEEHSYKDDILQKVNDRKRIKEVLEFVNSLGEEKKEIFIMRIWDNLSYEQIAQITGKTENNCKVIFSRTLSKVVERFGFVTLLLFFC